MSFPQAQDIAITTATGGGATVYSSVVRGRIAAVKYTKATGSPLASSTDITVTLEDSGQAVQTFTNINATAVRYPVAAANLPSGAASTVSEAPIFAVNERVKAVVASGGNTKVGTLTVVVA